MFYVNVQITGKDQALNQLQNLKDILNNFAPEMQKLGDYLLNFFTNDVFESQGNAIGHGWQELSMPYAYRKTLRWGPQITLVASGQMRAGYRMYTTTDSVMIQNEAVSKDGEYYARRHQDGSGFLPQRMLMDFDDNLLKQIAQMLVDSLNQRIRGI